MKKCCLPVFLWIVISSCGIYRQNVVNVPLMQQKGQVQAGGHISFNGFDGQASYAVTKKIGIMANYSDLGSEKEVYSEKNYSERNHYFGEAGIGIFGKTKKGKIKELFFLAGKGMTTSSTTGLNSAGIVSTQVQRVRYSRFLVQGDFGSAQKKAGSHHLTPVVYDSLL